MKDTKKIINGSYNAGDQSALNLYYKKWADSYDNDVLVRMGYKAPDQTVQLFSHIVKDKSARILDVGAGTGLVGEHLASFGYQKVDALDASQEMLDIAEAKYCYRNLICEPLCSNGLDIEPDIYDATICVGTYTPGHVGSSALKEVLDITRPGGYMCFTQRLDFYNDPSNDFKEELEKLVNEENMSLVIRTEPMPYLPTMDSGIFYSIWIYQKTKNNRH